MTKNSTKHCTFPSDDRYTSGIETLKRVGGVDYDRATRPLEAFSPDLAQMTVEHVFGDVLSRPGLDLKQREIAIVAALTAIGSVRPALKYHILRCPIENRQILSPSPLLPLSLSNTIDNLNARQLIT